MTPHTLLDVAIRQFGERGFEGASTRAIAAEAGTVMSSITYHYGGKKGLYLACAEYIATQLGERLHIVLDETQPVDEMSATDAARVVARLVETMAQMMLTPESEDWAQFIIREQRRPGHAFDRMYTMAIQRVAEGMATLVRIARPELGDAASRAIAVTLYGQALVLRAAHAAVLRTMGAEKQLNEAQQKLLIQTIHANVHAILKGEPQS